MDGGKEEDGGRGVHGGDMPLAGPIGPGRRPRGRNREIAVRDIVPDFDERGSVRIGAQPGSAIDPDKWLHIRFEIPIAEADQFAMLYWLDIKDMRRG